MRKNEAKLILGLKAMAVAIAIATTAWVVHGQQPGELPCCNAQDDAGPVLEGGLHKFSFGCGPGMCTNVTFEPDTTSCTGVDNVPGQGCRCAHKAGIEINLHVYKRAMSSFSVQRRH